MPKFKIATFMTCYIGIAVYLVNIATWKLIRRSRRVRAAEMDLVTNRREFELVEAEFRAQAKQQESLVERLGLHQLRRGIGA